MCLSLNKMNAKNVTISPNSCTTNKQRYIQLFSVKQTRHSSHMPSNILLMDFKTSTFFPFKISLQIVLVNFQSWGYEIFCGQEAVKCLTCDMSNYLLKVSESFCVFKILGKIHNVVSIVDIKSFF